MSEIERHLQQVQTSIAENAPALHEATGLLILARETLRAAGIQEAAEGPEPAATAAVHLSEAQVLLTGISEALPHLHRRIDGFLRGSDEPSGTTTHSDGTALQPAEVAAAENSPELRLPSQAEPDIGATLRALRDTRKNVSELLKTEAARNETGKVSLNEVLILSGINNLLKEQTTFQNAEVCAHTGYDPASVRTTLKRLVAANVFERRPIIDRGSRPQGGAPARTAFRPTAVGRNILDTLPDISPKPIRLVRDNVGLFLQRYGERDRPRGISIDEIMMLYSISELAQGDTEMYVTQLVQHTGYGFGAVSMITRRLEEDGILTSRPVARTETLSKHAARRFFQVTPFGKAVLALLQ
jgi:DNA-binding MarR family transcriptional regulator